MGVNHVVLTQCLYNLAEEKADNQYSNWRINEPLKEDQLSVNIDYITESIENE